MPSAIAAGALTGAVMNTITALEAVTGTPVAVIERPGSDLQQFYNSVARAVCEKTEGGQYCAHNFTHLNSHTSPLGNGRLLQLKKAQNVCLVVPPAKDLSPTYAQRHLSGSKVNFDNPSSNEYEAWLTLAHAASCATTGPERQRQAVGYGAASILMTLLQGDTSFVSHTDKSPGREIARALSKGASTQVAEATRRGTMTAERLLLEHWKKQAAAELTNIGCDARAVSNDNDTDLDRSLDKRLPSGACAQSRETSLGVGEYAGDAEVTDENLHLWMSREYRVAAGNGQPHPQVGEPPTSYRPFAAGFDGNVRQAVQSALQQAKRFAQ